MSQPVNKSNFPLLKWPWACSSSSCSSFLLVQTLTSLLSRLKSDFLCHPVCCYQLNFLSPSLTLLSLSHSVSNFMNSWKSNHFFIAGLKTEIISNTYRVLRVKEMWVWISFSWYSSLGTIFIWILLSCASRPPTIEWQKWLSPPFFLPSHLVFAS